MKSMELIAGFVMILLIVVYVGVFIYESIKENRREANRRKYKSAMASDEPESAPNKSAEFPELSNSKTPDALRDSKGRFTKSNRPD